MPVIAYPTGILQIVFVAMGSLWGVGSCLRVGKPLPISGGAAAASS